MSLFPKKWSIPLTMRPEALCAAMFSVTENSKLPVGFYSKVNVQMQYKFVKVVLLKFTFVYFYILKVGQFSLKHTFSTYSILKTMFKHYFMITNNRN